MAVLMSHVVNPTRTKLEEHILHSGVARHGALRSSETEFSIPHPPNELEGHIITVQSNQFCAVQEAECAIQDRENH